ncbi:MAG TPA: fumarate reductase/succinate dehydrogenase flavoprotein subunit, partial [Chthonomonadales bacterium]|nr:fumarate reductase/succinate dehydrogenase flavoprotein subunit [Chthonomonadales bacterium]
SLSDILVFGKRAGDAAADYAKATQQGAIHQDQVDEETQLLLAPLERSSGDNPYRIHQELQEAMQADCMIARTEEGLSRCLEVIEGLQERSLEMHVPGDRAYNPGWHAARDVRFMLQTSEIIVRCALARKESRGAQWRLDYLDMDPVWGKQNLIARRSGASVVIETRPLPEMPEELAKLFE